MDLIRFAHYVTPYAHDVDLRVLYMNTKIAWDWEQHKDLCQYCAVVINKSLCVHRRKTLCRSTSDDPDNYYGMYYAVVSMCSKCYR